MMLEDSLRLIIREEIRAAVREELQALVPSGPERQVAASTDLIQVDDVARACHVKPATVRAWIHSGRLSARKAGQHYLVRSADLERFLSLEGAGKQETIDSGKHLAILMDRINGKSSK